MSGKINFGKNSNIELSKLLGGLKKEALKTDAQKSIFNTIDTNKDGVIDDNEISIFSKNIDISGDKGFVDEKDAKKYIEDNGLTYIDDKGKTKKLPKEEIIKFLQFLQDATKEIKKSSVNTVDGVQYVNIEYKNGTTEVINTSTKTLTRTETDENGNTIVTVIRNFDNDSENNTVASITTTSQNGDKNEIQYQEDGKTIAKTIEYTKENSKITTTEYVNGSKSQITTEQGSLKNIYKVDGENEILVESRENEGHDTLEKITKYETMDGGVVIVNSTQASKTTTKTLINNELTAEQTVENGITTTTTYTEDGIKVATTSNNIRTMTNFDTQRNPLNQTKIIGDDLYHVEYDGNGNSKVIVQNNEPIWDICKKFGCDQATLLELNKSIVKYTQDKTPYFKAGQEIIIPKLLEADAPALLNRKDKIGAENDYINAANIVILDYNFDKFVPLSSYETSCTTYRDLACELINFEIDANYEALSKYKNNATMLIEQRTRLIEKQLKAQGIEEKDLPNAKFAITVTPEFSAQYNKKQIENLRQDVINSPNEYKRHILKGKVFAKEIHNIIQNNSTGEKQANSTNEILSFMTANSLEMSRNIVILLDEYEKLTGKSLIDAIYDAPDFSLGKAAVRSVNNKASIIYQIVQWLISYAKEVGVTNDTLYDGYPPNRYRERDNYGWMNAEATHGYINHLLNQISVYEKETTGQISETDAMNQFATSAKESNQAAQNQYTQDRKDESAIIREFHAAWTYQFGGKSYRDIAEKLNTQASDIEDLTKAAEAGDIQNFKKIYHIIFGQEFKVELIEAQQIALAKYEEVACLQATADMFNTLLQSAEGHYDHKLKLPSLDAKPQKQEIEDYNIKFGYSEDEAISMIKNGYLNSYYTEIGEKFNMSVSDVRNTVKTFAQSYNLPFDTYENKATALKKFLHTSYQQAILRKDATLGGKTMEDLAIDVNHCNEAAFGRYGNLMGDVNELKQNIAKTEQGLKMALEIGITLAFQFVPGLGQIALAKLGTTFAKWGATGMRFKQTFDAASKGLGVVNELRSGTTVQRVIVGSAMTGVGDATAQYLVNGNIDMQRVLKSSFFGGFGAWNNAAITKIFGNGNSTVAQAVIREGSESAGNMAASFVVEGLTGGQYGTFDMAMDCGMDFFMATIGGSFSKGKRIPPVKPDYDMNGNQVGMVRTEVQPNGNIILTHMNNNGKINFINEYCVDTNGKPTKLIVKDANEMVQKTCRYDANGEIIKPENSPESTVNPKPEIPTVLNPNVDYAKLNADNDYQAFIENPIFKNNPELKKLADELYESHLGQNYDTETGRQMTAEVKAEIVFRGILKKHNEGEITLSQEIIDAFLNPIKTEIYQNLGNKITAQNKDIIDNLIIKYGLEDCNCEQYLNFILEEINENNIELLRLLSQKHIPTDPTSHDTGLFVINCLFKNINNNPKLINITTKLLKDNADLDNIYSIAQNAKPETIDFVIELCSNPKFISTTKENIETILINLTPEKIELVKLMDKDELGYGAMGTILDEVKPEFINEAIKIYQNKNYPHFLEKAQIISNINAGNAPYIETLLNSPNIDIVAIMPNLNKNTIDTFNRFVNDPEYIKQLDKILASANNIGPAVTNRLLDDPNLTMDKKILLLKMCKGVSQTQANQILFNPNLSFDDKFCQLIIIDNGNKDFALLISTNKALTEEQKIFLTSSVNSKNQEVAMALFSRTNDSKLSFDEKIRIIDAASISSENIDWVFVDLYTKLDDPHIKSKVDEILAQNPITQKQASELRMIVDAIAEYNGHITAMDDSHAAVMTEFENKTDYRAPRIDLDLENRLYSMREYMKTASDPELANYMFENYYIKMLQEKGINPKVIKKVQDINNTLGVKIFLSNALINVEKAIDYTETELAKWYTASEGQAILPPVIDFSTYKRNWYDTDSAYGQGVAGAYSEIASGSIAFRDMTKESVDYAIRHEMTHTNDLTRQGHKIPEKYNINDCFPKTTEVINGVNTYVPDMAKVNQKWVIEFQKAGLSDWEIKYAFNNPAEFIAVASGGKMDKYSEEFKQVLRDFGMPEFVFKLQKTKVKIDPLYKYIWDDLLNKYPRKIAKSLGFR